MYVVKRPFKNLGKVYVAGTVIAEPATIKRFKGKLAEGKIIEVTEQTYSTIAAYFKDKFGVVLPPLTKDTEDDTQTDTSNEKAEEDTENASDDTQTDASNEKAEEDTEKASDDKPAKAKVKVSATVKK